MIHGATPAPDPAPRADTALAVDCAMCNGWGSVVTSQGQHELCPSCQPEADAIKHDGHHTPQKD
ncbi:hypothetical protein [Streptomyces chiangmaiensis]|uniref:Small CPxCG-related zinc finger protein n=1 Tax=Streptomyces chiangmaiensis TaxID=766497 RepID=A0ABU7FTA3_9ACTN|nr:hypothetical protein [Streptomyces chiangmaiensis]MED7827146.1 hypothetical protein [Streptomyces chiangmaiensis]